MGQAGTPPDPIEAWTALVAMPAAIVIARTEPTDEGCSAYFVKRTTSSIANRTAKPRTLTLLLTERPLLLKLDDLLMAVDDHGNLSPAKTTDTQHRMIFQELMVRPFLPGTCSESSDHCDETNLIPNAYFSCPKSLIALALCWSARAVNPPVAKTATAFRSSAN